MRGFCAQSFIYVRFYFIGFLGFYVLFFVIQLVFLRVSFQVFRVNYRFVFFQYSYCLSFSCVRFNSDGCFVQYSFFCGSLYVGCRRVFQGIGGETWSWGCLFQGRRFLLVQFALGGALGGCIWCQDCCVGGSVELQSSVDLKGLCYFNFYLL